MTKNTTTKPSSQRKLTFNDSRGRSNVTKQDESHIQDDGPADSFTRSKRRDHQSAESYYSPQKKRTKEAATQNVVTPDHVEMKKVALNQSSDSDYIPSYIHKNVEYVRKGQMMKLSPIQAKVLQWIEDNFEIPNDFEHNRKFGPLSGSSYADRAISAYRLGSLKPIQGSDHDGEVKNERVICTVCAELGHIADTCPTLL